MAKKTFSPLAFIDNGQIKITDEDGDEYISYINQSFLSFKHATKIRNIGLMLIVFFILALLSQPFFHFFSHEQLMVFGGAVGFLFFFCLIMSASVSDKNSRHSMAVAEYNRAKHTLQADIMQLEEQLTQHKAKMQAIENSAKFNFKREMEM